MKHFSDQEKSQQVRDGKRIGYRLGSIEKQSRVVAMIHGLASNSTRWSEFVMNTNLKEKWDLLRIDLRGHALSVCRERISRDKWSHDLRDIINAEGYQQSVLIGHSLGAQVAMHYAMETQKDLSGLVLIDPVFDANLTGMLGVARRFKLVIWFLLLLTWFLNLLGVKKKSFPARDMHELDKKTREFLKNNPDKDIAELYMNPLADLEFIPLATYLQDIIEVVRPVGEIEKITCPVLVLVSRGASMSDVDKNAEIIHRMSDSQIVYIDADHWLLTEKPDEARQVIEDWCDGLLVRDQQI
ncbi:MAG: alpha/beta hydrolase [Gammaproteobacteria bacterium]|nr:alpha/beta hydrolase [Gammaproteobacteria bacterium]MDH5778187.1 alpha/beta hydrolase [Gammaproteobacteria bacterium]